MPYQTFRLTGGVNTNETPVLNQAGVSSSQLVRFKPDADRAILVEKIGGWAKFYATRLSTIVRAMLGWEDTNANKWFAFGASSSGSAQVTAIQCLTDGSGTTTASGTQYSLTPQYFVSVTPLKFQTTSGSSVVTVTDNVAFDVSYNNFCVFITTPVSVGGLVLYGQYQVSNKTLVGNTYQITATDALGNAKAAAYSTIASPLSVTGGSFTAGPPATVTFTYSVQASPPFPVGDSVNVTGVSPAPWNGSGVVTACTTTQVTITAPWTINTGSPGAYASGGSLSNYGTAAQVVPQPLSGNQYALVMLANHGYSAGSTFTQMMPLQWNGQSAGTLKASGQFTVLSVINAYSFLISLSSSVFYTPNSVYSGGYAVTAGSSSSSAVTLTINNVESTSFSAVVTGGSSTISTVTLQFNSTPNLPFFFSVGSTICVSGVSPSAWNGTYVVTSATLSTVQYSLAGSALSWVSGGTITRAPFAVGAQINVANVTPSAWNGNYTVTAVTPTTVTYSLSGSALTLTYGGNVSDIGGDAPLIYTVPQFQDLGVQPQSAIVPSNWSMDNWGEVLLFGPVQFYPIQYSSTSYAYGPLFSWDVSAGIDPPQIIANSPPVSTGFFVAMPQRQVVCWGTSFTGVPDPLLVRWCDVNNYNVWIGQTTNQAGSYRLSTGSAIIGALQSAQQGLLWTDIGLWSMQYIGPPYVYSFNEIGKGCGLIARKAAGTLNGVVYWMGSRQFFMYSGEGVQPIPCPVWDVVFQQLDQANLSKICIAVNSLFEEVTWFFPVVGGSGENTAYIKYSLLTGMWDIGTLGRSAWIDNSVLGPPIGFDPVAGYVYQHEISKNADGSALNASFTTGWFAIADGQNKAFLDEVWPDFKWGYYNQSQGANVTITFNAADFPGQTPTTFGPYTVTQSTQWFNPRIRTRLMSVTISSSDVNSFWRIGGMRYRVAADGRY